MSTVVHRLPADAVRVSHRPFALGRVDRSRAALLWPVLAAAVNAACFWLVRPNVGDLQAALARQFGALHGVGLGYWFQWFGGGSTPGNYSVITPYLSAALGALGVGALATVAVTPLARRAVAGTNHVTVATWVATLAAALNIWSGRVPFAVGTAAALLGVIGVRERRPSLAFGGIILAGLCSPVTGAFLAFVLGAAFLVEKSYRRLIFWVCATCGVTLLGIAVFFGTPGPQGYPVQSALLASLAALFMLLARPAPAVRVALWCTALAAPLVWIIPNGLGSNFSRLPWLCLPVAVVATAVARPRLVALALTPALACAAYATTTDLLHSSRPAASSSYYRPLITQLDRVPGRANYRLEVVQDPQIHTAAYALLPHTALAGGYETQEQHKLNAILEDEKRLDATSYKIWLDNNAVGYVAYNVDADTDAPEYQLVKDGGLPYLTEVSRQGGWVLYRVSHATPIVALPQTLVSAGQATMVISVPCACRFPVRVRYSKFLTADIAQRPNSAAKVQDDGLGWTTVITRLPGTYTLRGDVTQPLR
ncbi:hypothetical protein [uncultured Jatrophihabitans sp.]|uniref:hypothetical protein n=1 Tax=uncultured Jatrophihabitans sp. TaxID=1610747 RepID=UPI0035C94D3F